MFKQINFWLVIITVMVSGISAGAMLGIAAFFAVAVLATFYLFFKEANTSFIAKRFTGSELSTALSNWSSWQWGRITLGFFAFAAALLGATRSAAKQSPPIGSTR